MSFAGDSLSKYRISSAEEGSVINRGSGEIGRPSWVTRNTSSFAGNWASGVRR